MGPAMALSNRGKIALNRHQVIHHMPGQFSERGVGKQVIPDFNQFNFHGLIIRITRMLFKSKIKKNPFLSKAFSGKGQG